MSDLRHIYRNLKLKHIPSKRYNRKYDPKYLDELASKGCSVKLGFGDFDGDTDLDGTYPKQRAGVAEKPGLHIHKPLRGPRNMTAIAPPDYGPLSLDAIPSPDAGPIQLSSNIAAPAAGPNYLLYGIIKPQVGPSNIISNIKPPLYGPSLQPFPPDSKNRRVGVVKPGLGPLNLAQAPKPQAGPSSLSSTVVQPTTSISALSANIKTPAAGPSSLAQILLPPTSFNGSSLNLTSSIVAPLYGPTFPTSNSLQIAPPSKGVLNLTGQFFVTAPSGGPGQLSSAISYDLINQGGQDLSFILGQMELSEDGNTLAYSRGSNNEEFYVFERSNSSSAWSQKGSTISGNTNNGQELSLSADGTHIITGGPWAEDPSKPSTEYNHGFFKVYQWNSTTSKWQLKGSKTWGLAGSRFGEGVAISKNGQVIAVGGPYYSLGTSFSQSQVGYFQVYEWDSTLGNWVQRGSTIYGSNKTDRYGLYLDLSDDGSMLLMSNNEALGKVYEWSGSEYVQKGSTLDSGLTSMSGYVGSNHKNSITGDGSTIAISQGTFGNDVTKVYQWNGTSWVQKGSTFTFGSAVSLSKNGSIIAIADGENDVIGVYRFHNSDWVLLDEISNARQVMSLSKDATTIAAELATEWRTYQNSVTS